MGAGPLSSLTSFFAKVNEDECIGCGTCVEKCPVDAIELEDSVAHVIEDRCIGCGVCVHFCDQDPNAISLERTGLRKVFILPKRIKQD
jgi:NAD-dependent dihydropyrimidine dehydrogenase PreA subunit